MINFLSASIVLFFEALNAPALIEIYTAHSSTFILFVSVVCALLCIRIYKSFFSFVAFLLAGLSLGLWLPFNFIVILVFIILLGFALARACFLSPLLCSVSLAALMAWDVLNITIDSVPLFLSVELFIILICFFFPKYGLIITSSLWGTVNAMDSVKLLFNSYFLISELLIAITVSVICIMIQLRISQNQPLIIGLFEKLIKPKLYTPKHSS